MHQTYEVMEELRASLLFLVHACATGYTDVTIPSYPSPPSILTTSLQLSPFDSWLLNTAKHQTLMFGWEKLQPAGRYLSFAKLKNDIMNKHGSHFQSQKSSFTQFVPFVNRPGMPGQWWILRPCCTTNTRTKDVMRRRSCVTPAVPAPIAKRATATARSTALTTVLCHHRARRRSMRWGGVAEGEVLFNPPYSAIQCSPLLPALPAQPRWTSLVKILHNYTVCIVYAVFQPTQGTCLTFQPHAQKVVADYRSQYAYTFWESIIFEMWQSPCILYSIFLKRTNLKTDISWDKCLCLRR